MNAQEFDQPITDLGFDRILATTNNYPDGFVTAKQLEIERKMQLEILEDNGQKIF